MDKFDRVRSLAYTIWEENGRPDGDGKKYWLQAEKMIEIQAVKRKPRPFEFDRRMSIRVSIGSGNMSITGTTAEGLEFYKDAIDVSVNGVRFLAPEGKINNVNKIIWHELNLEFCVSEIEIFRETKSDVVVILTEFCGKAKEKMKWIDLIGKL
ncbi:MAG: DUF2934 domain-containing protein [Magnetococcus sp. THC-1_WYH]